MPSKTRKMRQMRQTSQHKKCSVGSCECCDVTFHGLYEWYEEKFEKLGWMILAKHKGHNDKIVCYKTSLKRLEEAITHKIEKHIHDKDKKEDLHIMLHNVKVLQKHVDMDFGDI